MAPEYLNRGEISPEADIFSLGVIMIELITGHKNYPQTNLLHSQYSNVKNSPQNTQAPVQEFTEKVRKILYRHRHYITIASDSLVKLYRRLEDGRKYLNHHGSMRKHRKYIANS